MESARSGLRAERASRYVNAFETSENGASYDDGAPSRKSASSRPSIIIVTAWNHATQSRVAPTKLAPTRNRVGSAKLPAFLRDPLFHATLRWGKRRLFAGEHHGEAGGARCACDRSPSRRP